LKNILYLKFLIIIGIGLTFIPKVNAGEFTLDSKNVSLGLNCAGRIDINIDPESIDSNAADIEIIFDPTDITVVDENNVTAGIQIGTGNAYEYYYGNEVQNGRIRLTGVSLNSNLNKQALFGFVRFTGLQTGITTLSIVYTPQSTHDSNIARYSTSQDILSSVKNLTLNLNNQPCSDNEGPVITFIYPQQGNVIEETNPNILIDLVDTLSPINLNSIKVSINGQVYTINSSELTCQKISDTHYQCKYTSKDPFSEGQIVEVLVEASDQFDNKSEALLTFSIKQKQQEPTPPPTKTESKSPFRNISIKKMTALLETEIVGIDTPTFTSAIVLTTMSVSAISLIMQVRSIQLLFSLLGVLLSRKRSHPWGLVYEFSTFKPIPFAVVRLYDTQGMVAYQKVTDLKGRYGFPVNKGLYTLEVDHSDYVKQKFDVKIAKDTMVNIDVQMLPKTRQKQLLALYVAIKYIKSGISKLRNYLIALGFAFSSYALISDQNIINIAIFIIYLLIGIANLIYLITKPRDLSRLINSTNKQSVKSRALIKIFDRSKWTLVDTQISDTNGKFGFTLDAGNYALLVSVKGYNFPSKLTDPTRIIKEKLQSLVEVKLNKTRSLKEKLYLDPVLGETTDSGFTNPFA